MQIKDFGVNSVMNGAARKTDAKKAADGESFLKLMQEHIGAGQIAAPADTPEAFGAAGFVGEIEAIAARSRIIRPAAKNDVTSFLGLINKNDHLLRGVDPDALDLKENAGVTRPLSESDAAALRQDFDLDDLSPARQADLFKRLNELGVLSAEDIRSLKKSVTPSDGDLMDYLINEPGFQDVSAAGENDPGARLSLMIQNERYAAGHINQRYGQNTAAVSALAASHEKVLGVLDQI